MQDDFAAIRANIEQRLSEGATSRHSAMHCPAVATCDADVRTLVLRAFDPGTWRLRFHTDSRSPKVSVIADGAPVGVLFYDREAKLQIRVRGRGRIVTQGEEVDRIWSETTEFARRCYLGSAPGETVSAPSSGLPEWIEGEQPTEEQLLPARENFGLMHVDTEEVDWFSLSNSGHRRAVLTPSGDARWITP